MTTGYFEGRSGWILVYTLCIVGFGYLLYTYDDLHSYERQNHILGRIYFPFIGNKTSSHAKSPKPQTPAKKVLPYKLNIKGIERLANKLHFPKRKFGSKTKNKKQLNKINSNSTGNLPKYKKRFHKQKKPSMKRKYKPLKISLKHGSCSLQASLQGNNQKVIAFYLSREYSIKNQTDIDKLLADVVHFYPHWKVWFYGEPRVLQKKVVPLQKKYPNLFICDIDMLSKHVNNKVKDVYSGLWRVIPLGDQQVEVVLSRDVDVKVSIKILKVLTVHVRRF